MPRWTFEDDNLPFVVEVTPTAKQSSGGQLRDTNVVTDTVQRVAQGAATKLADITDEGMKNAFRTIFKMAVRTGWLINDLKKEPEQKETLSSVEMEFGVKFGGEGEIAITKLSSESNLNVKLTWTVKP